MAWNYMQKGLSGISTYRQYCGLTLQNRLGEKKLCFGQKAVWHSKKGEGPNLKNIHS
jgi:hypothetical protein